MRSYSVSINNRSADVINQMKRQVDTALETIGLVAEGYAARLCAVDTGRLRASITHQVDREEKTVYIGTNVEYAPYVEMGTGKYYPGGRPTPWRYEDEKGDVHWTWGQKAQPFLKPAIADNVVQYMLIIEQILRQ